MQSAMKSSALVAAAATVYQPLILTSGASGRAAALFSLRAVRSLLLLFNGFLLLFFFPFRRRTIVAVSEKSAKEERPPSSAVVVRVPAAMVRRPMEGETAARRAMAIRRLGTKEEDEEEDRRTKREFCIFSTPRGDTLFTQSWTPIAVPTKGLVVLMHGLNEHSGRYNHFAMQLNDSGFKVYAMDWIGHGGSDGLHGYVHSLDYAVDDLKAFLEKVLAENPRLPCFLFGHSTGAAIVLKAVLDPKREARIGGVVLTSPAIRVQASHPIIEIVAPIFSLLIPKYQFNSANKKGPPVSRDPEALKVKYSDPLVYTGAIRVRTGYEILRICYYLQQNLNRVTVPFLVLHGTTDTVTDPEGTQRLHQEASSTDKSIKLYEGFLHDLLFEPERDGIARSIIDWLSSRLDAQSRS
ncbi:uncharacterized protein M6B38_272835 [Iris pallida]|uniref:Serine aminopeptidase S33 domain-containing protein n=1 Tax=Iris pallida TaxID=29817 RepID=A0AAX6G7Z1_IRIPA|nr:uncharacterized protein M6B38_381375 [Iris pallida]KAJ6848766.1 uncharacterized protein M6B38_272835 [Iris pallida]